MLCRNINNYGMNCDSGRLTGLIRIVSLHKFKPAAPAKAQVGSNDDGDLGDKVGAGDGTITGLMITGAA